MTIRPFLAATAALAAAVAVPASAVDLTLSSPDDLSMLTPGQSFTVNVNLGDLDAGTELSDLFATAVVPDSALIPPADVMPGAIVPNPGVSFIGNIDSQDPGTTFVDGVFTALTANIDSEGTFFSFMLTADSFGSGVITLDADTATASDATFAPVDVTVGDGLAFAVVPEPATLGLLAAAPALLLRRRR